MTLGAIRAESTVGRGELPCGPYHLVSPYLTMDKQRSKAAARDDPIPSAEDFAVPVVREPLAL